MFVDPNFGMYARDLEICEYISKIQKDKNYPRYTRASTGKNRKDRISKAFRLLKGHWRSFSVCKKEKVNWVIMHVFSVQLIYFFIFVNIIYILSLPYQKKLYLAALN